VSEKRILIIQLHIISSTRQYRICIQNILNHGRFMLDSYPYQKVHSSLLDCTFLVEYRPSLSNDRREIVWILFHHNTCWIFSAVWPDKDETTILTYLQNRP